MVRWLGKILYIHFGGVSLKPRGGKVGEFIVRHRDRDIKGRFIHFANNTLQNIFRTSKTPLTNPAWKRHSRGTTRRGEIVLSEHCNESKSIGTLDFEQALPL